MGYSNDKLVISQWLVTPAHEIKLPVFHDRLNTSGDAFSMKDLLEFDHLNLNDHFPKEGKPAGKADGVALTWQPDFTDFNGYLTLPETEDSAEPQIAYMAVYIESERYTETTLEVKSPHMLRAWHNGRQIGVKSTTEQEENTVGRVKTDLTLERGKHLLVIKTLKPAEAPLDWKVMANLEIREPITISDLTISLNPLTRKNIDHILEGVKTTSIQPSHDGSYYSVSFSLLRENDQTERWTEIRRTEDRSLVHSFRHARVTSMKWLPNSNRISYLNTRNGRATLFLHDLESGSLSTLMEDMEQLQNYHWAPNEQFIIYSVREEGSSISSDIRQVLGMADRQSGFRNRQFLYKFEPETGFHQRLTFGNLTTSLQDISPDNQHIVFSESSPDYQTSPFSRQSMYLMDVHSFTLDTLWFQQLRGLSVRFSPDGKTLLATGGPAAFDGIGLNLPEETIPNNYDRQAFLFDLETREVTPFTRDFDPSVIQAYWHKADNMIYLLTTDRDFNHLYRYDVQRNRMEKLDLGMDYITSFSLADNARMAIVSASQVNAPSRHFGLNLRNLRQSPLINTEADIYRHVEFGQVKDWNFTSEAGIPIKGRVYYPPAFDPENQYPVIVYYYAGTTPVGRTFGGRYPFNLWAGNNYIVYVLQPSGAIGFGQEFSAAHVNNWGITVADEIIEGTQKFLAAHPYANANRIGCAGASYGGFMTMLLMTRTDIFTAAISHAGISSISSYWGEGYWGYGYSAEASANSYPWNNHDLYVGQSPLFFADRVQTPLLLITGDSDTNVPPGESIQMFTALKILGRPVELIKVRGEDHHIITPSKRRQWHHVIMAWWDKYLKDQPQWWEDQFPERHY